MKSVNDKARSAFHDAGLSYKDIGSKEIGVLVNLIKYNLSEDSNDLDMKVCTIRQRDVKYDINGNIEYCYILVDANYFKRREAISFNQVSNEGKEFIGFAGWASTNNCEPFIKAFEQWIRNITYKKSKK